MGMRPQTEHKHAVANPASILANSSAITVQIVIGSGMSVQDLEPFRTRANQPNVGWGFAEGEVVSGSGIITSASVIDSRTNDPTTIPPKM